MLATKSKIQNFHRSIKNPVCLLERRLLVEDAGRKQVDAIKQQDNSPAANKQQKSKDLTTPALEAHLLLSYLARLVGILLIRP
jgi:hypothetical protein